MKKVYFVILFFFLTAYICVAQSPAQTIENIKIGFITRELNLTSAEAYNFWPAYNGYIYELKNARLRYPRDEIAFGEARVNIQKRYRAEFKRILGSDDRVNNTFLMEVKYREMLRRELINRQNNQQLYRQSYPPPVIRKANPPVIVRPGKRF